MSTLTLKLKSEPTERLDLSSLTPSALGGKTTDEIARLNLTSRAYTICVGDVFDIAGTPGDTIVFDGGSGRLDFIGANNEDGTLIVEGDVGAYAGQMMKSGRLEIRGNAGAFLASSLQEGLILVNGSAGDNIGAPRRGDRDGISGGNIVVKGDVGDLAGTRMRRGTIIAHGKIGAQAGARMMGGTIWGTHGFGQNPGVQMRRGLLIAPTMEHMLPTFLDCGFHDLGIVKIMNRYLQNTLHDLAPKLDVAKVHKYAGDMASLGKGEIFLTG